MKYRDRMIKRLKNENADAERTRVVCYGHKAAYKDVNYGSRMTLRHGPDYKDDHNVIQVLADDVLVGNIIHRKLAMDRRTNMKNNDELIDMIEDGMVANLVYKIDNQLIIDIPKKVRGYL